MRSSSIVPLRVPFLRHVPAILPFVEAPGIQRIQPMKSKPLYSNPPAPSSESAAFPADLGNDRCIKNAHNEIHGQKAKGFGGVRLACGPPDPRTCTVQGSPEAGRGADIGRQREMGDEPASQAGVVPGGPQRTRGMHRAPGRHAMCAPSTNPAMEAGRGPRSLQVGKLRFYQSEQFARVRTAGVRQEFKPRTEKLRVFSAALGDRGAFLGAGE